MKHTISARLSKQDLLRHLVALGGSGSGKTTLLLQMFYDMVRTSSHKKQAECLILLEPHGDFSLQAGLIRIIPRERLVFISNAITRLAETDTKYTFTFNPFENDGSEEMRYYLTQELTHAITELLESSHHSTQIGMTVQMATILSNAIAVTLASDEPSILTLKRMFTDNNEDLLRLGATFPHPQIAEFMRRQFMSETFKATRASILVKLSYFLNDIQLYQILGHKESSLKLDQFIEEGRIIIIHTPKGISANVQSFLGRLIVARVFSAMLRREATKIEQRRPVYMFIDEFQSYLTSSLAYSMQEARKYLLGCLLSSQSLKQVSDSKIVQSIVTNTYWKLCGVIDADNIISFGKNFGSEASTIATLQPLQFLCKRMGNSEPFRFTTKILPQSLFHSADEAKELYQYLVYESGLYVPVSLPPPPPAPPPAVPLKTKLGKKTSENTNPFDEKPAFT